MLVIMNLWRKKSTIKRRLKAKTVAHPDGSNVRISNYVKIIDKQHARFDPARGLKKVLNTWKIDSDWKSNIYSRRNYCKIKIAEDSIKQKN